MSVARVVAKWVLLNMVDVHLWKKIPFLALCSCWSFLEGDSSLLLVCWHQVKHHYQALAPDSAEWAFQSLLVIGFIIAQKFHYHGTFPCPSTYITTTSLSILYILR